MMHMFPGGADPKQELKLDPELLQRMEEMRKAFEAYLKSVREEKENDEEADEDSNPDVTSPYSWFLGNIGEAGVFVTMIPSSHTRALTEKKLNYTCQDLNETMTRRLEEAK